MKDRKDHVDEVFKGLKSFIKDKDIFEWYKSLIVDSIDIYVAHTEQNSHKHGVVRGGDIKHYPVNAAANQNTYTVINTTGGNTPPELLPAEGQEEANTCADGTLHEWKVSPDNLNDVYCKKCYKSA